MQDTNRKDAMTATTPAPLTLSLTRHIKASPERVFAAWTQPELIKQWFSPKPVETVEAHVDLRVGGSDRVVMRMPDGTLHPHEGVYLEVEPGRRLVSTSSFGPGWQPMPPPAPGTCNMPMTVELTFLPEEGGTRYNVLVKHATVADREAHETMGFHSGWNQATDQLAALVEGPTPITPTQPPFPRTRTVNAYLNFDGRCAEALVRALQTWPYRGIPDRPEAWLAQTVRNLAFDQLRRLQNWERKRDDITTARPLWMSGEAESVPAPEPGTAGPSDETIRMLFVCADPGSWTAV